MTVRDEIILRELARQYSHYPTKNLLKAMHSLENGNESDGFRIEICEGVDTALGAEVAATFVRMSDIYNIGDSLTLKCGNGEKLTALRADGKIVVTHGIE